MFTLGLRQRKWVYPALFFLLLLLLFLRFLAANASAVDTNEDPGRGDLPSPGTPPDTVAVMDSAGHSESDFLLAVDQFNRSIRNRYANSYLSPIEAGYDTLKEMAGRYQSPWPDHSASIHEGERSTREERDLNDLRYQEMRRRIENQRAAEGTRYRNQRRDIERMLSETEESSSEYTRLERLLNEVDRQHAERERDYERDFKSIDVDFAVSQW